ncbi:fatty acid hydroxylase superfamily-domain-containing protein [Globomyces pollinis-pini]|nr:fatty acid hydroxylase superfamily-domain-containing protein [Globomyces pollinis-pini]
MFTTEKFLRLFYLVSPAKTTFTSLDQVPDYINEAIPYFVMTIGLEAAFYVVFDPKAFKSHKGKWNQGKFRLNDMIGSITAGSLQQLSSLFIRGVELGAYIYVWDNFRLSQFQLDATSPITWIAAFLAADCGYYWFHRAAHEINLFWAAHAVHHSSEYYNQTTALRQSIVQVFTSWMFYLPAALIIPPTMFSVHKQLTTLYQYWIHTETVPRLGWLEYIINTPSAHRVHHGRNPYCIDKNYAGTLIIWDRMFGTYQEETDEKVAFGTTHPINTFNPIEVQTVHFKHVLKTCYETPGIVNKLKVLFYGPGWHDDTPRLGLNEEIPPISQASPPVKYDPIIPTNNSIYALVHTGILIGLMDFTLLNLKKMPLGKPMAAWITLGFFSIGQIIDGKQSSRVLEITRMILGLGLTHLGRKHLTDAGFSGKATTALSAIYGASLLYSVLQRNWKVLPEKKTQ